MTRSNASIWDLDTEVKHAQRFDLGFHFLPCGAYKTSTKRDKTWSTGIPDGNEWGCGVSALVESQDASATLITRVQTPSVHCSFS